MLAPPGSGDPGRPSGKLREEGIMRTLARWNPFRELAPFASFPEMETYFGEFPFRPLTLGYEPAPTMPVDVTEAEAMYTVKAEIPGMNKEDIAVSIDGNAVSITAETKREKEGKEGEKNLRTERYYGMVSRVLTLPSEVDPAKAEAAYEGGVLTLTLPKAAGTQVRRLPVH
jgi:HSP20 family protein